MKSFKCSKNDPLQGTVVIKARIIGKLLFFLMKDKSPQKTQMINKFKSMGANIEISNDSPWFKVDMFENQERVKLSNKEFDVRDMSDLRMEEILYDFYKEQYLKAKFLFEDVNE